jgi:hypothetical protein
MNRYKKYISIMAVITLTQVSCLKDSLNTTDPAGGSNNVVEFQNTSIPVSYSAIWPQYDNGVTLNNDTGSFPINFNYAGPSATTSQDINITVALSQAALDSFNTDQGTSFVLPPADTYTLPTTATIARGGSWTQIWVKINTGVADYDYNASYALPLRIVSASSGVVSSNFGTAIYSFVGNNAFAGTYLTNGYFFHPSSPRAITNQKWKVATAGQFSNKFPFGDLYTSNYYFIATTPSSGSGALTNYIPTGATPSGTNSGFMDADDPGHLLSGLAMPPGTNGWVSSTYNNTYDATNKTFWIHVGYVSAGGHTEADYSRQVYMKMVQQ